MKKHGEAADRESAFEQIDELDKEAGKAAKEEEGRKKREGEKTVGAKAKERVALRTGERFSRYSHVQARERQPMKDLLASIRDIIGNQLFQSMFGAVVLTVATHIVAKLATKAMAHLLHQDANPLPTSSIIINIVRAGVWAVGASIILDSCFNVNTSSLVAALGVGGIAVSLGFQDTLSNLIGGLQMTFMGIVKPGDNIQVDGEAGVVQDVTWRHTTIRDALGQTIVIPNSVISTTALTHLLPATRVAVPFAIPLLPGAEPGLTGGRANGSKLDMERVTDRIIELARDAAGAVSPITSGPSVFYSEITEFGIKGKVIMNVEDALKVSAAGDAVVRALARELR